MGDNNIMYKKQDFKENLILRYIRYILQSKKIRLIILSMNSLNSTAPRNLEIDFKKFPRHSRSDKTF